MRRLIPGLPVIAMIAAGSLVMPASTGLAEDSAGAFVQTTCASCHAVRPFDRTSPRDGATPFADLAGNPAITALALRVMLQTSHQAMPNLRLTPDQTATVIAYILNLRRPGNTVMRLEPNQ